MRLSLLVLLTLPFTAAAQAPTEAAYRAAANLVGNPDFEQDWTHNKVTVNTRFRLLEQSDWGYAQADGLPDFWVVGPTARLDTSAAKFGKASLRLDGAATQVVYLLGETDPKDGGSHYNAFLPLPAELSKTVTSRPLRFGAWCKTKDAAAEPTLTVTVEYGTPGKITPKAFAAKFGKGTHDWEYREVKVPAAADLGPPHAAVVRLEYHGGGTAWFDGVLGEEEGDREPNLLPNGGFEELTKGFPTDWSGPELWSWSRREYYRFTGWSHEKGRAAGGTGPSPLARSGGRSLQLTVLPGDNLAVRSERIALNQTEPRMLEAGAWVWADNLRWLEVMARDEKGEWLPQQDFSGFMGTDEQYRNRVVGIGTHGWEFVRKHFAPRKPVKEVTLWLCARGMDGRLMGRNVVGTAWFDDVELRERGTPVADLAKRGVKVPAAAKAADPPFRVVDFDPGERLWGPNEMRLRLRNPSAQGITINLGDAAPTLTDLAGKWAVLRKEPIRLPARGDAELVAPYRLTELPADWQKHYRFGGPVILPFGAPASPVAVRLAGTYVYPDERLDVGVRLNVSRAGLKEVGSCRVVVKHPKGEKVLLQTDRVAEALWTPDKPRPAMLTEGYVDARNLIPLSVNPADLPRHPFTRPVRDCRLVVTLTGKDGKAIAEQTSEPFGCMDRPPAPSLPDKIEKTTVAEGGTILVNGQPYVFNCFPSAPVDLGGVDRQLNFPKTHKIAALPFPKELLFTAAEEADWKAKVQEFVKANKGDPKLFGYYFDHNGETTFWFDKWKEMAACQRKVVGWVRGIDPNHVILSARWLFGHTALTPEAARHFDFLDELDVEPGLTWTPDSQAVRRACGRPVAVVAGLECYSYQPVELLRWRAYEALRQGANGVGICPSGMLAPKPEVIGFLRGLYGEVEGLKGMIAGKERTGKTTASSAGVTVWERTDGAARYVVAMTGEKPLPMAEREVTFTLPAGEKRVEVLFEGREVPVKERTFTDRLEGAYTVRVYRVE